MKPLRPVLHQVERLLDCVLYIIVKQIAYSDDDNDDKIYYFSLRSIREK